MIWKKKRNYEKCLLFKLSGIHKHPAAAWYLNCLINSMNFTESEWILKMNIWICISNLEIWFENRIADYWIFIWTILNERITKQQRIFEFWMICELLNSLRYSYPTNPIHFIPFKDSFRYMNLNPRYAQYKVESLSPDSETQTTQIYSV